MKSDQSRRFPTEATQEGFLEVDLKKEKTRMGICRQRADEKGRLFPRLTGIEMGFLLLCFVIYLFWMLTFPMQNYGPDEYMRYDIPEYIYEHTALPMGPEEELRNPIWGISYGFDISLPYLLQAGFMKVMSLFDVDGYSLLMAARLVSALSTLGAAWFALLFAKKQWGEKPIRWVFPTLIALLPQIVFLASYVNLDSFSLFTIIMIVYSWKVCLDREWDTRSLVLLAVSLGLCFLSYYFAYSYILITVAVYCVWFLANRRTYGFKLFIRKGLLIVAIALAICGWRFVRNAVLYHGDLFVLNASKPYAELYAVDEFKPSNRVSLAVSGMSLKDLFTQTGWLEGSINSLIGVFGYLNVPLPSTYFVIYKTLFYVGCVGTLVMAIRSCMPGRADSRARNEALLIGLAALAAGLITVMISAYYSWSSDYQAQGRYILAVVPFAALVITFGLEQWMDLLSGLFPHRRATKAVLQTACCRAVLGFMLVSVLAGFVVCLRAFGIAVA